MLPFPCRTRTYTSPMNMDSVKETNILWHHEKRCLTLLFLKSIYLLLVFFQFVKTAFSTPSTVLNRIYPIVWAKTTGFGFPFPQILPRCKSYFNKSCRTIQSFFPRWLCHSRFKTPLFSLIHNSTGCCPNQNDTTSGDFGRICCQYNQIVTRSVSVSKHGRDTRIGFGHQPVKTWPCCFFKILLTKLIGFEYFNIQTSNPYDLEFFPPCRTSSWIDSFPHYPGKSHDKMPPNNLSSRDEPFLILFIWS